MYFESKIQGVSWQIGSKVWEKEKSQRWVRRFKVWKDDIIITWNKFVGVLKRRVGILFWTWWVWESYAWRAIGYVSMHLQT
jgi:hypothetical protein